MKFKLNKIGFIGIIVFHLLSAFGQTNSVALQNEQIEFEIVKVSIPKVKQNGNALHAEEINFLSSDEIKVLVSIEYYKTKKDVETALKKRLKILGKCDGKDKVTDEKGKKMGMRYTCQNENTSQERVYIILYNYGSTLFEYSSSSVKHLKTLESDSCPRSNSISGRKCPEIYLQKNWEK